MSACETTIRGAGRRAGMLLAPQSGLRFQFGPEGWLERIDDGLVQLSLFDGASPSVGVANLYLRRLDEHGNPVDATPLLGPHSPARLHPSAAEYAVSGEWSELRYAARLVPLKRHSAWLWVVSLENDGPVDLACDVILVQDVGLGPAQGGPRNHYAISQYVDYHPLSHPLHGTVVCCRQTHHGPGCMPWLALGASRGARAFATDGLQFYGRDYRATGWPEALRQPSLGGLRQGECGIVALQTEALTLAPGGQTEAGFFAVYAQHHPEPTGPADLDRIDAAFVGANVAAPPIESDADQIRPVGNLFTETPLFQAEDLDNAELEMLFGVARRHAETDDGRLLSFFCGDCRHVVLRGKELLVDRPHGAIIKSGETLRAAESEVSSTCYMFGIFHSHVAHGNVDFNRLLTVCGDPIGLMRHVGQRMFVQFRNGYEQLGVPSAFEIGLNGCRWIYKRGALLFQVQAWASPETPELHLEVRVLSGQTPAWLVTHHLSPEHRWEARQTAATPQSVQLDLIPGEASGLQRWCPGGRFSLHAAAPRGQVAVGGDELVFREAVAGDPAFLVAGFSNTDAFRISLRGGLTPAVARPGADSEAPSAGWERDTHRAYDAWRRLSRHLELNLPAAPQTRGLAQLAETLPWFAQNAQIHCLTPHGLEQYGGAAWGTRDICQGPLELLLSLERYDEARGVLATVLANQSADGEWPQWWMFDRYRHVRAGESHGDIIFWPILAVSEYVRASGDFAFLDAIVPFFEAVPSIAERATVADHLRRAIDHIVSERLIDGVALVTYSDGDWNDAMQPADAALKDQMVSAWTVCLSYQAFGAYADVCRRAGRTRDATQLATLCERIRADFAAHLIRDDVVAGYGLLDGQPKFSLLLHPSDQRTGIRYRLLPMIRGIISGIFTPAQAERHLALIEAHLLGPDGARLMDRPPRYRGGEQKYFQRGEASPFFGREVGLMYMHAHLRYAEALARVGRGGAFVDALRRVIPLGVQSLVPCADRRQANCYFSSSDAAVSSRYEIDERYDELLAGRIAVKGGWRIYSSGPGIFLRLVFSHLLGIRHAYDTTVIDPVLPCEYDGLQAKMRFRERDVTFVYHVSGAAAGPERLCVNGVDLDFERETNPYRTGGAVITDAALAAALHDESNIVDVYV